MRVLITAGSRRGGTEGLACMLADDLRSEGVDAEVIVPEKVGALDGYDAVVIGGALYANRWHRAARRFVRSHADQLRERPAFFFSSGPLDNSATEAEIPPVRQVRAHGPGGCQRARHLRGPAVSRGSGLPGQRYG